MRLGLKNHSQLSQTCLIGTLAYQQIYEKIDVNRKSLGISAVWRTSTVCKRLSIAGSYKRWEVHNVM